MAALGCLPFTTASLLSPRLIGFTTGGKKITQWERRSGSYSSAWGGGRGEAGGRAGLPRVGRGMGLEQRWSPAPPFSLLPHRRMGLLWRESLRQ